MTAPSNAANTTSKRSSICSTTTEGDQTTTPPAGQNWERGDTSLASKLLSKSREARGYGLLFYHSSREDSSRPFDEARGNSVRGNVVHGSHKRKASRELISSQERQLTHDRRGADRRKERRVSSQREVQQQRRAQRLEVDADWKICEVEMRTTALLEEQRRGIINQPTHALSKIWSNSCISNIWNYKVGILTKKFTWQPIT